MGASGSGGRRPAIRRGSRSAGRLEAEQRGGVGEDRDDVGDAFELLVDPLDRGLVDHRFFQCADGKSANAVRSSAASRSIASTDPRDRPSMVAMTSSWSRTCSVSGWAEIVRIFAATISSEPLGAWAVARGCAVVAGRGPCRTRPAWAGGARVPAAGGQQGRDCRLVQPHTRPRRNRLDRRGCQPWLPTRLRWSCTNSERAGQLCGGRKETGPRTGQDRPPFGFKFRPMVTE